jgi:hypothetical protein
MEEGSMIRSVRINRSLAAAVIAAVACLFVGGIGAAPKQPQIQTGPDAEVTADGLVRVKKSVADAAWVKPDFDLTPYTKLMIVSGGVSFKKLKPVSKYQARNETEFPVSQENQQKFKDVMKEEFVKELSKLKRYQIVDKPGPDVLTLVGAVIDVVSNVPPDIDSAQFAGRGGVYLTDVGDATLVIELRDSQSNEVLGRAADRRAAESPFVFEVNNVTAWTQVHLLAQAWASTLRKRLEEIEKI